MEHKYLKNVATLIQNIELCTNCGQCLNVCPHQVFGKSDGYIRIKNLNACMECGACVKNCTFDALSADVGVGCAVAIINGLIKGTEPNCDCGGGSTDCC